MIWHKITDADSAPKDDKEVLVRIVIDDDVDFYEVLWWDRPNKRWNDGSDLKNIAWSPGIHTHWADITPPEEEENG